MTMVRPDEDELRRMAADGVFQPATTADQEVDERVSQIEQDLKAGRINSETAIRRLDEETKKVARLREAAILAWGRESADWLDTKIRRVTRKADDDPVRRLAEGRITADEARRRGVEVR